MKVRIGVSLGQAGAPDHFSAAVDALEAAGVDSLWLPEMVYGSLVDPFIGMAHALGRTSRLKVGTGVWRCRPDVDPERLIASGWAGARATIGDYVDAGLTKFVIRPSWAPVDPDRFTADFAREMMPLQT